MRDTTGNLLFVMDAPTLPEKCVWASNDELYCAVPRLIPTEAILPDDYLRGTLNTQDQLVLFNLAKKETKTLFSNQGFDMANLLINKSSDRIFFVNRVDGSLWGLKIR